MSVSAVNLHLTAIRKLAREAAANGRLSHEAAAAIVDVKGDRPKGVRRSTCLTPEQAQALLEVPAPDTLRGKRDRALLALLRGCGLRRDELAISYGIESNSGRKGG
jgi:site-specific recombinase XerD